MQRQGWRGVAGLGWRLAHGGSLCCSCVVGLLMQQLTIYLLQ